MIDGKARNACIFFFVETAAWLVSAGLFFWLYLKDFGGQSSAIVPHLKILGSLWLAVVFLRLISWIWIRGNRIPVSIASALISLPLLALILWYLIALVGLSAWGRITTWPLIKTYSVQSPYLMDALGLPSALLIPALLLLVTLPVLFCYFTVTRFDWTRWVGTKHSAKISTVIALAMGAISAIQIFQFVGAPANHLDEPFSLSFFPDQAAGRSQSHRLGNSRLLDSKEALARKQYKTNPQFKRRNVVLIVGDALRYDHMSLYGYGRVTTPLLQARSRSEQMTTIAGVRAVCAESACGLLGLAASRAVHDIPTHPFTLHEVLRRHGYAVDLILGGDHTNFYGLKEAYGKVDSYFDGSSQIARYINDDLLVLDRVKSLPRHDPSHPALLQLHLMSTHGLGLRHEKAAKFQPFVNYYRWPKAGFSPESDDSQKAVNYYDNGMVQFDQIVDELLSTLKDKGYLEDSLVVITGDHGESLGEHGMFSHAHQVYEGALAIPFVAIRYGYQGSTFSPGPVLSQIDIAPTILRELEIPEPATWEGQPLQGEAHPRFIRFQQARAIGLYDTHQAGRISKYWKDTKTGKEYVFDVKADPLETRNLFTSSTPKDLTRWRDEVMSSELVVPGE